MSRFVFNILSLDAKDKLVGVERMFIIDNKGEPRDIDKKLEKYSSNFSLHYRVATHQCHLPFDPFVDMMTMAENQYQQSTRSLVNKYQITSQISRNSMSIFRYSNHRWHGISIIPDFKWFIAYSIGEEEY